MIPLTRLNGHPLAINSDLIKMIENAPDTVITLISGEKIVVRETGEQILEQIIAFRRRVLGGLEMNFSGWASAHGGAAEDKGKPTSHEDE